MIRVGRAVAIAEAVGIPGGAPAGAVVAAGETDIVRAWIPARMLRVASLFREVLANTLHRKCAGSNFLRSPPGVDRLMTAPADSVAIHEYLLHQAVMHLGWLRILLS